MPLIYETKKLGRSVDVGDLLTKQKRNVLIQTMESKQSKGIYKQNLYNRGFELINLEARKGIDSLLVPTKAITSNNYLQLFRVSNNGSGKSSTFADGIWVFCGQDKSGSGYNVYAGTSLSNLSPKTFFGNGTNSVAYSATFGDGIWVICGRDSITGTSIYFGTTAQLIAGTLSSRGLYGAGGYAISATFGDGIWVICGQDPVAGYNVFFGSTANLNSLTPYPMFGAVGKANMAVFVASTRDSRANLWVICGYDRTGSDYNIFYGLTSDFATYTLNTYSIFTGGVANSVKYIPEQSLWIICGQDPVAGNNIYYGYHDYFLGSASITDNFYNNSLTPYPAFTRLGYATSVVYGDNNFLFYGKAAGSNNNIYYGTSLTYDFTLNTGNLIPYSIFPGSNGVYSANYANNQWVIYGQSTTNTVYYGTTAQLYSGTLIPKPIIMRSDVIPFNTTNTNYKGVLVYLNGYWVICGSEQRLGSNNDIYYTTNISL